MSNTAPTGNLDHDRFLRTILQLRNTPDHDCNLSPAQIIFGLPLRDSLTFVNRLEKFSNPHIQPLWRQAWTAKEEALCTRISRTTESLQTHSRPLRPLITGDRVFLQNQHGANPTKWDRSGLVVESLGHDQYRVKIDGSGRLTLCNRRFLRAYTPVSPSHTQQPAALPPPLRSLELQLRSTSTDAALPAKVTKPTPDEPCGTSSDASQPLFTACPPPTATDDDPQPDNNPAQDSLPTRDDTDSTSQAPASIAAPPLLPPQVRPTRTRRAPPRFEPETGTWVKH